jgi:hypothetical protein
MQSQLFFLNLHKITEVVIICICLAIAKTEEFNEIENCARPRYLYLKFFLISRRCNINYNHDTIKIIIFCDL